MDKSDKRSISRFKLYIENIKEAEIVLQTETKERKIEKAKKTIKNNKLYMQMENDEIIKRGDSLNELLSSFDEYEIKIINEVFSHGSDKKEVEIEKEIHQYKKQIEKILKAKEKDSYEPDWPMEKKKKTRLFAEQDYLKSMLVLFGKKESKHYVDIWNYERDYESTKDKYFTSEEQEIIAECLALGKEYKAWYQEKYKWRVELGNKLISAGEAIGEWGELTQVKMDAQNLAEDVFPVVVDQIHGDRLSKKECMEESRLMARRYIEYRRDPEREAKALSLADKAIKKAELMIDDMWEPMEDEREKFEGATGMVLDFIVNRAEKQVKDEAFTESVALELLTAEYGSEEAHFIMLLNHENNRESRSESFRKYSFEEMGI